MIVGPCADFKDVTKQETCVSQAETMDQIGHLYLDTKFWTQFFDPEAYQSSTKRPWE